MFIYAFCFFETGFLAALPPCQYCTRGIWRLFPPALPAGLEMEWNSMQKKGVISDKVRTKSAVVAAYLEVSLSSRINTKWRSCRRPLTAFGSVAGPVTRLGNPAAAVPGVRQPAPLDHDATSAPLFFAPRGARLRRRLCFCFISVSSSSKPRSASLCFLLVEKTGFAFVAI